MKASTALPFLSAATVVVAQQYGPFIIDSITTHQPSGVPSGQVNYYSLAFNLSSSNGATPETAFCWASWGDNSDNTQCYYNGDCVPYSTGVPTGQWIQCAPNKTFDVSARTSGYAFQLFPYFSIGNFSVQLKQNFTNAGAQTIVQSDAYHISNTTSNYTCQILSDMTNPSSYIGQHARGDCSLAIGAPAYHIPVTSGAGACTHAAMVNVGFPVTETTSWGDTVYVTGNIPQLGNWNLNKAVALNANQYTAKNTMWNGSVPITANTAFEYKYAQRNANGRWLWECGENRIFNVSAFTCGAQDAGSTPGQPDYFRCGTH